MSDDIVKEIREARIALPSTACKAADEIEKLREELDAYDEKTKELCDEITCLSAENERLREALNPFVELGLTEAKKNGLWGPKAIVTMYVRYESISNARAALEGVTKKDGTGNE